MPKKIQVLPDSIAQTIAAGEVVERPASVVKELLENAIDAGSSEIVVELRGGGLQLIRVYDNGEGIEPEDLPLALQRYATSKISKAEDLYAIRTLGFRGEALPSIASVSKMTIKTRVANSIKGTGVCCEGGEIKAVSEVGCPVGTEVEVEKLFFNVPVKRKFLKSIRSELRHCLNHFLRLSLSRSSISFRFIHDGRTLEEHIRTDSPRVRMEAIFGREIVDQLQAFEFEEGGIKIFGFKSVPSLSKASGDGIYLYVNQRYVKDRIIHRAIMEGYRHIIPAGRFPVAVLFITLPRSAVDVNVHPTKAEVKFRDPEKVFHAVVAALRSSYENPPRLSKTDLPPAPKAFSAPWVEEGERTFLLVREALGSGWKREGRNDLRILGQIQGTYLVCEGEKGLILIDQHAAHERILFERYKERYETGGVSSEKLLLPVLVELTAEESFLLGSHPSEFEAMGFEIDPAGERTYAIRSIPSFIQRKDLAEMIKEILDELSFLTREGKGMETVHAFLVTLACHSSVRGNSILRKEEMEELVRSLSPFDISTTCPHGRPIFFVIPLEELAKQFKRKG
jgi:DNA mismatch repair protein MutL